MDQVTLREFDRLCLMPIASRPARQVPECIRAKLLQVASEMIEHLEPAKIKQIRETANVSQAVFAAILNTSLSTVQKWEVGQKRPTGTPVRRRFAINYLE